MKQTNKLMSLISGDTLLSSKYHQHTSIDKISRDLIPYDKWDEKWKRIFYKEYPRFPKIVLQPNEKLITKSFLKTLQERSSQRNFSEDAISFEELSTFLNYSAGINPKFSDDSRKKRFFPSGGMRFPSEIYLLVREKGVNGLLQKSYHYNIKRNCLEELFSIPDYRNILNDIYAEEWVSHSDFIVCITSIFNRSRIKYGDRGYRYCLLEAGHIAQNFSLMAASLGLKCCALGGFSDKTVENHLHLNEPDESAIYLLAIGK